MGCDFYHVGESEWLTHTTIEDAVLDYKNNGGDERFVTVYGYNRAKVDESMLSDFIMESIEEYLGENYGDPEGDMWHTPRPDWVKGLAAKICADYTQPWSCELVHSELVDVADYAEID